MPIPMPRGHTLCTLAVSQCTGEDVVVYCAVPPAHDFSFGAFGTMYFASAKFLPTEFLMVPGSVPNICAENMRFTYPPLHTPPTSSPSKEWGVADGAVQSSVCCPRCYSLS
eukprot:GGOE01034425.1.p7 GENE.GGOE01034425.1~~GGOE01034425.1.p7  ORF type:complete len:111 (-),score=3.56 GGOE01034425.1:194-526(-)